MKRKRAGHSSKARKRPCLNESAGDNGSHDSNCTVDNPVLKHYYPVSLTLRQYLLKQQRVRLNSREQSDAVTAVSAPRAASKHLDYLLDNVIVARKELEAPSRVELADHAKDLTAFTQQVPTSTIGVQNDQKDKQQLEIVNFAIWVLFRQAKIGSRPQNLLCQGYEWAGAAGDRGLLYSAAPGVPGIACHFPNRNVDKLTSPAWALLLSKLGKGGHLVMVNLLLHCALFEPSETDGNLLVQISGAPLTAATTTAKPLKTDDGQAVEKTSFVRSLNVIKFARTRMLYGRCKLTRNGDVRFGLPKIHCFTRHSDHQNRRHTVSIMRYIFPRQFKLHNVFTSQVDHKQTTYEFQDYSLRVGDVRQPNSDDGPVGDVNRIDPDWDDVNAPQRLRKLILPFVAQMQNGHNRCPYAILLDHHCPSHRSLVDRAKTKCNPAQPEATPASSVAAFCWAVLSKILPFPCWGAEDLGKHNRNVVKRSVKRFVDLRRTETMTLHDAMQQIKIRAIPWLALDSTDDAALSKTDLDKRSELLAEFVYFIFDSVLMPLIKHNFYVTESNTDRNRLFYYRQDVWRAATTAQLRTLKNDMLVEVKDRKHGSHSHNHLLSYSQVRLLPKLTGFRVISNLKRRPVTWRRGKRVLGQSINSALNPVYKALLYEKSIAPEKIGSSLFSVNDIYAKIQAYTTKLRQPDGHLPKLYFAKLDVRNCFDSIPQDELLTLVSDLFSAEHYHIERTARFQMMSELNSSTSTSATHQKPQIKYSAFGRPASGLLDFEDHPTDTNSKSSNGAKAILVPAIGQTSLRKPRALNLLREHIRENTLRIGKKFYQQKTGIPQGSVLSALLCNFFYADLEQQHFGQWLGENSLLLRLVDDFLLITPDPRIAQRFVKRLYQGFPEYGVSIKLEKSLLNFDMAIDGQHIPRTSSDNNSSRILFPYCGIFINTQTLSLIKRNQDTSAETTRNSLTIDYTTSALVKLRRKIVNAFKLQLHTMFLDTMLNSIGVVLRNLYVAYQRAASRCLAYWKDLVAYRSTLGDRVILGVVDDLEGIAFKTIRRQVQRTQSAKSRDEQAGGCSVHRAQNRWLAVKAFIDVLRIYQSRHGGVITTLEERLKLVWPKAASSQSALRAFM